MKRLKDCELLEVKGGGIKMGILFGIVAGLVLISGIVDGIFRPKSCH